MTEINGKTILLTGASGGLGSELACALADQNATVIGVSRSHEKLEKLCQKITSEKGKAIGIPFDISQIEDLPILVNKVKKISQCVDIVVNNAAIEIYKPFQNYSNGDLQSVLLTNLIAPIELTRLFLPSMLSYNRGHIVNIISLAAKKGHPYDSLYSASKGGLLLWTDALRQEMVDTNIIVTGICPGYISTKGMLADTGIPSPKLAGISTPEQTIAAILGGIQHNRAEVLINQNPLIETLTKLLFSIGQFSPLLVDRVYQVLGITSLNKKRAKNCN